MGIMDGPSPIAAAAPGQRAAAAAAPTARPAPNLTAAGPVTLQMIADGDAVPAALPGTPATVASAAAASVHPAGSKCSSTMRLAELTVPGSGTPGSGDEGHRVMPTVLLSTCRRIGQCRSMALFSRTGGPALQICAYQW